MTNQIDTPEPKDPATIPSHNTEIMAAPSAAGAKAHSTITMILREEDRSRRGWLLPLGGIGTVVAGLLVLGLFLPPISVYSRYISPAGDFVDLKDAPNVDGLRLSSAGQAGDLQVHIQSADAETYRAGDVDLEDWQCAAAESLPTYLQPTGTVYSLETRGSTNNPVAFNLTKPSTDAPLDIYGYDPALARWRFFAVGNVSNRQEQGTFNRLPTCLITAIPTNLPPVIGATLYSESILSESLANGTDRLYPTGLIVSKGGQLLGTLPAGIDASNRRKSIPIIANYRDPYAVDVRTIDAILSNPDARQRHVTELLSFASEGNVIGLAIDYRNLPATDETAARFTQFLVDLSRGLQAQGKILVVILPAPQRVDGQWQTGGYDWAKIGQLADEIILRAPLGPQAYADDGQLDEMLEWATLQINRYQLFLGVEAVSVEMSASGQLIPYNLQEAATLLGAVEMGLDQSTIVPGETLSGSLSSLVLASERDAATQAVRIEFGEGDIVRTLWHSDKTTLAFRLDRVRNFRLGGAVLMDGFNAGNALLADTLSTLRTQTNLNNGDDATIQLNWVVRDAAGEVVYFDDADLNYTVSADRDVVNVAAIVNIQGQPVEISERQYSVATSSSSGDTEQTGQEAPTEDVPATEPTSTPSAAPTLPPTLAPTDLPPAQQTSSFEIAAASPTPIAIVQEASPTPITFPTNTPFALPTNTLPPTQAPVVQPTATFAPVNLPLSTGPVTLELGGQIEQVTENTFSVMRQAGMSWVLIQLPYASGVSPVAQGDQIEQLHEQGFKVMYTVVGQAAQVNSSANFNRNFANFVAALAVLEVDAIQVWSAPDSRLFWPETSIDPANYVELLRAVNRSVRVANPDTLIVSAALEPGDNDELYYQGMAAAGAADLIDCIGVRYEDGTVPPDAISGDPRGDDPQYYLPSTIQTAYDAFGGSRPICLTIGYLSAEGYAPLPDDFSWASDNTNAEQAQWLGQAVDINQTAANVQLMFVWNVDFTFFGFDAAAGYAIIRRDLSCPACDALNAAMPR